MNIHTTYTPEAGSLAEKVCAFFLINPDEAMSARDIVFKYKLSTSAANVETQLEACIAARLLKKAPGNVYAAGERIDGVRGYVVAPAPKAKKPHPAQRRLPDLDASKLQVRKGVPLPALHGAGQKKSNKYAPVMDLMIEPGDHVLVPTEYLSALRKAASKYSKDTGRKFAWRSGVKPGFGGVWRLV